MDLEVEEGGGIRGGGGRGGMGWGGGELTRLQEHHLEKYKSSFIVLIPSERRLRLPPNDAHTSTSSSQYLSVFCFLLKVKGSPLQSRVVVFENNWFNCGSRLLRRGEREAM